MIVLRTKPVMCDTAVARRTRLGRREAPPPPLIQNRIERLVPQLDARLVNHPLSLVVGAATCLVGREQPGAAVRLGHVSPGRLPVLLCHPDCGGILRRHRGDDARQLGEEGVGNDGAAVGIGGAGTWQGSLR